MGNWAHFFAVVSVQCLFCVLVLSRSQISRKISASFVSSSLIAGIVFGVPFDLFFGKYLGVFRYVSGFVFPFLIVNGALSYGLMILTVRFFDTKSFLRFYAWTVALGIVYELVNYVFPVWLWQFSGGFAYREGVVIFAAYGGLSLLLWNIFALSRLMKMQLLQK